MADGLPASQLKAGFRRWLPLLVIALGITLFFALGLQRYLSLDALQANRASLAAAVQAHRLLALAAFTGAYALVVALSLPGATALTLAGGYLFGTWFGGAATVVGATAGACLLFLAARSALAPWLKRRARPWLERLRAGFQANAFSYMLFLRLVPAFPFFIVNLVPAFLGIGLGAFSLATLIGIAPASFIFASLGAGLANALDQGRTISLRGVLTPGIVAGLLGLALLSLLPVAYRRWHRR